MNAGLVDDNNDIERLGIFADQFWKYYTDNLGEDEDSDIQINWEAGDDHKIDFKSRSSLTRVPNFRPKEKPADHNIDFESRPSLTDVRNFQPRKEPAH